jgi:hypothetical protein
MNSNSDVSPPKNPPSGIDLDALLHPALAYTHPRDVVGDPDLTLNEKRAVLASWASDACAVEAAPALRSPPGAERPVQVDDILEALRALDGQANELATDAASVQRQIRRRAFEAFRFRRKRDQGGIGLDPSH